MAWASTINGVPARELTWPMKQKHTSPGTVRELLSEGGGVVEGSAQSSAEGVKSERRGFLERMAEHLGARAGVKSAYGEPVERDGVTVIPVAKVAWGFGGGDNAGTPRSARRKGETGAAGQDSTAQGLTGDTSATDRSTEGVPSREGSGGGGGVAVSPIGYVEIAGGRSHFRRIWTPGQLALMVAASGVAVAVAARAVGRLAGKSGHVCGAGMSDI